MALMTSANASDVISMPCGDVLIRVTPLHALPSGTDVHQSASGGCIDKQVI